MHLKNDLGVKYHTYSISKYLTQIVNGKISTINKIRVSILRDVLQIKSTILFETNQMKILILICFIINHG